MSVQLHASGTPNPSPNSPPAPGSAPGGRTNGALGWLLGRAAPNLLVLFALGALAWWGHHTGSGATGRRISGPGPRRGRVHVDCDARDRR